MPLASSVHAAADRRGTFFRAGAGAIAIFDGGNFDVEIDAVEERSENSLAIALDLKRAVAAFALQIFQVPTGTGIHCRDEQDRRDRDGGLKAYPKTGVSGVRRCKGRCGRYATPDGESG